MFMVSYFMGATGGAGIDDNMSMSSINVMAPSNEKGKRALKNFKEKHVITEFHGYSTVPDVFVASKLNILYNINQTLNEVTLVTHLTVDRMERLRLVCRTWQGPISAVIYIRDLAVEHTAIEADLLKWPCLQNWVSIHYIFAKPSRIGYPINHLRNAAVEYIPVKNGYILSLDVDFVPMGGMEGVPVERGIWRRLRMAKTMDYNPNPLGLDGGVLTRESVLEPEVRKSAYVIPAFECDEDSMCDGGKTSEKLIPQELQKVIAAGKARPVLSNGFFLAHEATDYSQWWDKTDAYQVNYGFFYEPYYVLEAATAPSYDESFSGYGHDKASHAYELAARGYRFVVLPEMFVLHRPHNALPQAFGWTETNGGRPSVYRKMILQMRALYKRYGYWPPVPSPEWFPKLFHDDDKEQAEFKRALIETQWEIIKGKIPVDQEKVKPPSGLQTTATIASTESDESSDSKVQVTPPGPMAASSQVNPVEEIRTETAIETARKIRPRGRLRGNIKSPDSPIAHANKA